MEVDGGVELSLRVWPDKESKAACRNMSGEVTAHQDGGANDLRGEELQYRAGAPHYVRGAALVVFRVPDGTTVTAMAPVALLRASDGTLPEGLAVVRASCEFEMELQAATSLEIARPDFSGLAGADARYKEEEREIVWLLAQTDGWEIVDSVVKEVGAKKVSPFVGEATCYSDVDVIA